MLKDVLTEIKKKNNSILNFQADFKEFSSSGLKQGKIYIRKPFLKIEYFSGRNLVTEIYINETKFYIYFINQKIVYEQDLKQNAFSDEKADGNLPKTPSDSVAGTAVNPLAIIDFNYLDNHYNFNFNEVGVTNLFSIADKKKFNLPARLANQTDFYHFKLTPKDVTQQLDELKVWFDRQGRLLRVNSLDIQLAEYDIFFYNFNNESLPDNLFEFIIPVNVRTVKNILTDDISF